MQPYDGDHNLLPHLEAMARHSTDLIVTGFVISMHLYKAFAHWLLFTSTRGWSLSNMQVALNPAFVHIAPVAAPDREQAAAWSMPDAQHRCQRLSIRR